MRKSSQRPEVAPKFTPLNRLIESAISTIGNRNSDKDVWLRLDLASQSPNVRTNDFYRVFSSLLLNSLAAITREGGNIAIETQFDNQNLHIIFEDDGCGTPKHMRSRMFNALVTAKERRKKTRAGLAIVKKIVEKYAGEIEVKTDRNAGTRMRLTFPVAGLNS